MRLIHKTRKNLIDNLHLVNWFFSKLALLGLDLGDATVTLMTFLVSFKAQTAEMGVTITIFVTTQDQLRPAYIGQILNICDYDQ